MGLHHPAAGHPVRPGAVLLCNPFGQEAVRTHRMYRVLAERLSRDGMAVMRFDYFGTGDSQGDDDEGDLDVWRDDLLLAHRELQRRAPGVPVTWVGVRLGATLCCLAAGTDLTPPPDRLVLWEPLTDGPDYLAELAKDHRSAVATSYSMVPDTYREPVSHEALGFAMGEGLKSQLDRLAVDTLPAPNTRHVTLISGDAQPGAAALARQLSRHRVAHRTVLFEHTFNWTAEEALNTALVPTEALQLLASALEDIPNE